MSIFSALHSAGVVRSMEEALGAKDITSPAMQAAIRQWSQLYYTGVVDADKEDGCQRLPVVIVGKLTKTAFAEYEAKANTQGKKAALVEALLLQAGHIKERTMQAFTIGGECFIKPVPTAKGFELLVVCREGYIPLARRADGAITDMGLWECSTVGGRSYTLLERRTLEDSGGLVIQSTLYQADNSTVLGRPVPLATLPRYARLEPVARLAGMDSLGMVQLRTPLANCVDGSVDGVSVYAPAVGLIRNVNRNEQLLCDEFEHGKSRLIASDDMITKDESGKLILADDLFVAIDDDPEHVGVTIFSPTLREQSYLARKNEYLRNCESLIGLKRGILSEVEAAERTATEITSSAGDYNLTIIDFQKVWEDGLRELVGLCDKLGRLYLAWDNSRLDPQTDVVVGWGNGILYDEDKEWERQAQMVQAGMLMPERALGWKYNLPCDTPEERAKIREDYMPEMENLLEDDLGLEHSTVEGEQVVAQAEDMAGKTLNGAQTQSLVGVIAQYQSGQLTMGQAINIIAIAIGVTRAEAQKIIEGVE